MSCTALAPQLPRILKQRPNDASYIVPHELRKSLGSTYREPAAEEGTAETCERIVTHAELLPVLTDCISNFAAAAR